MKHNGVSKSKDDSFSDVTSQEFLRQMQLIVQETTAIEEKSENLVKRLREKICRID